MLTSKHDVNACTSPCSTIRQQAVASEYTVKFDSTIHRDMQQSHKPLAVPACIPHTTSITVFVQVARTQQ
jgi:hypothetical protein